MLEQQHGLTGAVRSNTVAPVPYNVRVHQEVFCNDSGTPHSSHTLHSLRFGVTRKSVGRCFACFGLAVLQLCPGALQATPPIGLITHRSCTVVRRKTALVQALWLVMLPGHTASCASAHYPCYSVPTLASEHILCLMASKPRPVIRESKDSCSRSVTNLLLLVTCPLPAVLPAWYLLRSCQTSQHYYQAALWAADINWLCTLVVQRPVSAVACLFMSSGVVLWAISLAQRSTWVSLV